VDAFDSGDVALLPDVDPDLEFSPMRAPVQGAYRGADRAWRSRDRGRRTARERALAAAK
jgi:hypothetical protein